MDQQAGKLMIEMWRTAHMLGFGNILFGTLGADMAFLGVDQLMSSFCLFLQMHDLEHFFPALCCFCKHRRMHYGVSLGKQAERLSRGTEMNPCT